MSLVLDKRQRAMLREMGVRVWQPAAPASAPTAEIAMNAVAESAEAVAATPVFDQDTQPIATPASSQATAAPVRSPPPPPRAPSAPTAGRPPSEAREGMAASVWSVGEAQPLYADTAHGEGSRWLLLAETPPAALQREPFTPFEGEAGRLLDNMLRAARLHKAGVVLLAPLVRRTAGPGADFPAALAALVAQARPDVVLVMGRLASQALLQSSEPFGKLRGQVHSLYGSRAVLTYDATYLLRSPADKAKAWDDLCLAMSVAPTVVRSA